MKYIYRAKNWYKIGESVGAPSRRIQQQDNASNPEPLIIVSFWSVDDKLTDKKVHNELENLGFVRLREQREWFELSDSPTLDIADCLITLSNKVIEGELPKKPNLFKEIPHYSELWWYKSI